MTMMNKEAREILGRLFLDGTNEDYPFTDEFGTAVKVAIEALERNEPKKVNFNKTETYGSPYCCPSCGAEIVKVEFFSSDGSEPENKVSYCWKCGQALDWEDCEVRNE